MRLHVLNQRVSARVVQAREETEEAIQSHNHRYNAMLNEHIGKEERLADQIEQLKLSVADATRSLSEAQRQHSAAAGEAAATLARSRAAWDEERRAVQRTHDQVRHVTVTQDAAHWPRSLTSCRV